MKAQAFVAYLETLKGEKVWTRARAALRRSLAFNPGTYPPAFPFVEPFVASEDGWRREAFYLVAGLYGLKDGAHEDGRTLARALREARENRASESVESRFLALLDADRDQIAYRLRFAVALVKDGMDFARLLDDLLWWFNRERTVQSRWAREYYRQRVSETRENKEEVTA